jgi:putative membrane protein
VELGRLASQKAQDAEVKSFAQMMVADHGKANAELQTVAAKKQVAMPTAPAPDQQATMSQLQGLSGAAFDKAYVDTMVAAHEKDVALFERQAASDADPDAKAFAAKTLPTLKKHLEAIKGIQSKLK